MAFPDPLAQPFHPLLQGLFGGFPAFVNGEDFLHGPFGIVFIIDEGVHGGPPLVLKVYG
jgi:hypothetical protein